MLPHLRCPKVKNRRLLVLALATLLVAGACGGGQSEHRQIIDGLNEPRGLWLQADGTLCVVEAGRLAVGQEVEDGPTANRAETGSVTCVDPGGRRQRIIDTLPYVLYNATGNTTGPADLAEMEGDLYLLTGEGEGIFARKILKLTGSGNPPEILADLLAFATETAEPDFFDEITVFSNPYSMIPDPEQRRFLVTDGASGQVLAAGLDGRIQVFSEVEGHEVLTGIVRGPDEAPYVTSFSQLPHTTGDGALLRLHPDGTFDVAVDGLTTPIDVAFDGQGRLYVLEFIDGTETDHPYRGKTGRLLRFAPTSAGWGDGQVLIDRLPFPTALLIDAEDRIYVSIRGAFSPPESGVVVRFDDLAERPPGLPPLQF
jgi:hypothetical protein